MRRNLKIVMVCLLVPAAALVLRLAYIQILGHDDLYEAVKAQSLISLEGSNTRGIIYDRNGAPLVAQDKRFVYIIKDESFRDKAAALLEEAGASPVNGSSEGYHVYASEDYDRQTGRILIEEYGACILQASSRYSNDQPAVHLIGYVNREDSSGAAGLELMYDEQLSGLNRKIYAVADVKGNILPGRGLIISSDDENDSSIKDGIRTTVDGELQEAVEEIIEEKGSDCAVVVLDTQSGGIAAMACTPGFDPHRIEMHLNSSGNELINKVTQGKYAPGSLFKIFVAAAALERGMSEDRTFVCEGAVKSGKLTIDCSTGGEEGHGQIGLEDAFAQSCNSYFIQLGKELGADTIIDAAENFGLGEKRLEGYPQESAGHLMTEQERWGDAIGNLCIGQGETLVTPLQMAAASNIIANDGVDKGVHLLIDDEADEEQVVSQRTAAVLQRIMGRTVSDGTASGLGLTEDDGKPRAAAKTGTAEYGDEESGGIHAWITGYAPCDAPEYTITILVENGVSGTESAGPVFARIVEYLEESGSYSRPALA